jgi:hypothetical protein
MFHERSLADLPGRLASSGEGNQLDSAGCGGLVCRRWVVSAPGEHECRGD